jgi:hypothetical protein
MRNSECLVGSIGFFLNRKLYSENYTRYNFVKKKIPSDVFIVVHTKGGQQQQQRGWRSSV